MLRTRGAGINPVGVDEITVPGVRVRRVARLPERLPELVQRLGPAGSPGLRPDAVDVVLSRSLATRSPDDDEETGLDRDITLPGQRVYRLYGMVRPAHLATDSRVDALLGVTGDVVATAPLAAFDNPDVRASFVVDGNGYTGWSPADPVPKAGGSSSTVRRGGCGTST